MDQTKIKTLYVFVEISIDSTHLHRTIRENFPDSQSSFRTILQDEDKAPGELLEGPMKMKHLAITSSSTTAQHEEKQTKLALVSTIQFVSALSQLHTHLSTSYEGDNVRWKGSYSTIIPRSKPLSPGEILGCTAPKLDDDVDALMYVSAQFVFCFEVNWHADIWETADSISNLS